MRAGPSITRRGWVASAVHPGQRERSQQCHGELHQHLTALDSRPRFTRQLGQPQASRPRAAAIVPQPHEGVGVCYRKIEGVLAVWARMRPDTTVIVDHVSLELLGLSIGIAA